MTVIEAPTAEQLCVEQIFRNEHNRLRRLLLRRCQSPDVVDDVLAETFICAHRAVRQGHKEMVTPAWLNVVAKRRLVDHWRRVSLQERLASALSIEPFDEALVSEDQNLIADELGVHDTLSRLSPRQRSVLELRYLQGKTVGDVAAAVNLTYGATESLLARSRRAFAALYSMPQSV